MVLTPRNFSTRIISNENTPPALPKPKSLVRTAPSLQESTKRRRRRVSGSNLVRAAALTQQMQRRRHAAASRSATRTTSTLSSTPTPVSNTFKVPRVLKRPPQNSSAIRRNLNIASPDAEDVPYQYIIDSLDLLSKQMLETVQYLCTTRVAPGPLPTHIEFQMPEKGGIAPSHVLAVYSPRQASSSRPHVTLLPIHNQIIAARCANIPPLPNVPVRTDANSRTIRVPVVSLPLHHPDESALLLQYLYTRDTTALLTALLGSVPPASLVDQLDPTRLDTAKLSAVAKQLAHVIPDQFLGAAQAKTAKFWMNAFTLNVHDDLLWHTIQLAWRVLGDARVYIQKS